jgi:hypothetical protein
MPDEVLSVGTEIRYLQKKGIKYISKIGVIKEIVFYDIFYLYKVKPNNADPGSYVFNDSVFPSEINKTQATYKRRKL